MKAIQQFTWLAAVVCRCSSSKWLVKKLFNALRA